MMTNYGGGIILNHGNLHHGRWTERLGSYSSSLFHISVPLLEEY